ncbi:hypothetical protein [Halopelagius fulvigenes]|uniref:Uncharacterized protein n=1 Tax=Halopelagius fulvigenes TaxID=1198324 RepID=A0ABD5U0S8_9EURY
MPSSKRIVAGSVLGIAWGVTEPRMFEGFFWLHLAAAGAALAVLTVAVVGYGPVRHRNLGTIAVVRTVTTGSFAAGYLVYAYRFGLRGSRVRLWRDRSDESSPEVSSTAGRENTAERCYGKFRTVLYRDERTE